MNTDELKALIGKECLVIDALSKRGLKEPATIVGVILRIQQLNALTGNLIEQVTYRVKLHKVTSSKNRYKEVHNYQRVCDVAQIFFD